MAVRAPSLVEVFTQRLVTIWTGFALAVFLIHHIRENTVADIPAPECTLSYMDTVSKSGSGKDRLAYPLADAAELLGVSVFTLRRDVRAGKIRTIRYGTKILIPHDVLQLLAQEGMTLTESERSKSA